MLSVALTCRALHQMELPAFVVVFGPVVIGMNYTYDYICGTALEPLTLIGLVVVVLGVVMDVVLKKSMIAMEDEATVAATDMEEKKPLQLGVISSTPATSSLLGIKRNGSGENSYMTEAGREKSEHQVKEIQCERVTNGAPRTCNPGNRICGRGFEIFEQCFPPKQRHV
jgi:6,7-dimethyl-8-ribityllumazine synthase